MQRKHIRFSLIWILLIFVLSSLPVFSEPIDFPEIQKLVQSLKSDPRGPYQGIRWFYPDGTIFPARSPSPDKKGGHQHALLKYVVVKIQEEHGIYLGQILTGTKHEDFLDARRQYSRIKQYQIEQYLKTVDDGWIFRRAQYYRGAFQVENEEKWGAGFLRWLLSKDKMVASQFFLCRQATQQIPHGSANNRLTRIRGLAKNIANELPSFMDIRVKIHGQPGAQDLVRVKDFRAVHQKEISPDIDKQLQELQQNLESVYQEPGIPKLANYIPKLPENLDVASQLKQLLRDESRLDASDKCKSIADLLWTIREEFSSVASGEARLTLMDLSIDLESILIPTVGTWKPETIAEFLEKSHSLARAAAGCGFLEVWEWRAAEPLLEPLEQDVTISLEALTQKVDSSRRVVYWGTGMVRASYESTMSLFSRFEPLASGFTDDRIRASVLLSFGDTVAELSDLVARFSGLSNHVLGTKNQNSIRGLNPGFAVGELELVTGSPKNISFSTDKIYVLQRTPEDLKPVAGIAAVAEGNLVSHAQLLARNMGIPNAILSSDNLKDLIPFSGRKVFYAVSPHGAVLMKLAADMTAEERSLVEGQRKREVRVRIPTDEIDLKRSDLVSLLDLHAYNSGRICGPKAANLAQLRHLFPDKVSPGFVIPFGVFRNGMDQPMTGTEGSFWDFLQETFAQAARERDNGRSEAEIEGDILLRLSQLREAIRNTPLPPEFIEKLRLTFREVLGREMGQAPVFIRSDTNMEDLEEFTGAGLNLTVPNVVKDTEILQAIQNVWASPFSERSYRWRQKYLLNPEDVYSSVLILESVNVDKSGVMITTSVVSSDPDDLMVVFNWGVGGAVDGQITETYLLRHDGSDVLLSPTREPLLKYLPQQGGVEQESVHFGKAILNLQEKERLRELAHEIRQRLSGISGIGSQGPFDVELGFLNGSVWLFQVRPFAENTNARSTAYLQSMDNGLPRDVQIPLMEKIAR
ncbi:PEP/pyruvate-binding domain-containing protein [Candidatus Poribacteria bacterium]